MTPRGLWATCALVAALAGVRAAPVSIPSPSVAASGAPVGAPALRTSRGRRHIPLPRRRSPPTIRVALDAGRRLPADAGGDPVAARAGGAGARRARSRCAWTLPPVCRWLGLRAHGHRQRRRRVGWAAAAGSCASRVAPHPWERGTSLPAAASCRPTMSLALAAGAGRRDVGAHQRGVSHLRLLSAVAGRQGIAASSSACARGTCVTVWSPTACWRCPATWPAAISTRATTTACGPHLRGRAELPLRRDEAARRRASARRRRCRRWCACRPSPGTRASRRGPSVVATSPATDGEWHWTADRLWEWKGDTSSDELVGHFYAFAVGHDLLPDGPIKADIRRAVSAIADHLIRHRYYSRRSGRAAHALGPLGARLLRDGGRQGRAGAARDRAAVAHGSSPRTSRASRGLPRSIAR